MLQAAEGFCSALKLQSLPASTRCCRAMCLVCVLEIGKKMGFVHKKKNQLEHALALALVLSS